MRPAFPAVLDSTIIADFRSCPQRCRLAHFDHWKGREPSVHLHAGAAYAKGLETARRAFYEEGLPKEEAEGLGLQTLLESYGDFQCPPESAKSCERTAGALEFYFERYPFDSDPAQPIILASGKRAIEFNFAEPLDVAHPETGDPLVYCGRMDMLASLHGMVLGEDDKTTSQLGASWPRQWDLRSQFTGYVWGAKRQGQQVDGFLVRGVSILKTKYDTMEAITYRPEWQLSRWYDQLLRDVDRMIRCWREGYFDFNLDHACTEYGGCQFRQVCLMQDSTALLEQQFQRRHWNPLTRTETVL